MILFTCREKSHRRKLEFHFYWNCIDIAKHIYIYIYITGSCQLFIVYSLQENGDSDRACWFDTSMTSTVAGFLSLKSSMFSNITHNLNIAVRPAFEALRYSLYNPFHKPYGPSLRVRGVWTKRGQEHRSTQFQLFRIPFKDLQKTVSESVLPLIYRSYVRLQEYCPVRRHNTREAKVLLCNIILIFKYYIMNFDYHPIFQ